MVKDNIQVDKLLQPIPESEDLDYPTEPHYDPALSDETTAEKRQRQQRNVKRRADWQNSFKDNADKGHQVDNIPWEEADNKAKSLKYLSLGSQAAKIFHQRFLHTNIQKRHTKMHTTYKNALEMHSSNNSKKHSYKQEMKHLIVFTFSDVVKKRANP